MVGLGQRLKELGGNDMGRVSGAFHGKIVKPGKNSIFLKNGKMVILIENLKFFYILVDKTDFTVGIVS